MKLRGYAAARNNGVSILDTAAGTPPCRQAIAARLRGRDRLIQMEPHIAGLQTPTLIVWGKEDRSHNVAAADILHKLLPHSEVIIIPDAGHLPMFEQPKRCARDYLKFRQSLTNPNVLPNSIIKGTSVARNWRWTMTGNRRSSHWMLSA
jgi:pimeloyl-ACP methyl ester carboxylesterase